MSRSAKPTKETSKKPEKQRPPTIDEIELNAVEATKEAIKKEDPIQRDVIQNRILVLNNTINNLLEEKQRYAKKAKECDVKITQLVGAVSELDGLLKD